jgi:hypothetical protein
VVQRGGSADKVGNAYEALWTVLRLTHLLDDSLRSVRFEPPGVDGAELRAEDTDGECFDQVKFRSAGPWSIHALIQDGVFAKLTNQYADGARVQLVLSNGSPDLERLLSKAKSSETLEEFLAATKTEPNLGALASGWGIDTEGVWRNLQNTSLDSSGFDHLKQLVLLRLESLVMGSPESVCALLEKWAVGAQQQTLTGPILWNQLVAAGHPPQPRLGDPVNSLAVRRTLERYLSAVKSAEPDLGMADRGEVNLLVRRLEDNSSPRLIVVHGRAGTGKTSVAAAAIENLAAKGVNVAAVRLDGMPPDIATADQLGQWAGLPGSPAIVLNRLAGSQTNAVLLIDQLDAVSQYSGRMPQSFSAVDEIVRQASLLGNVLVVLVSRTVDMEHDQRIRRLANAEGSARVEIGELTDVDLDAFLRRNDIDPSTVDRTTIQLLRLPIQLSIFSRLAPELRRARYDSLTQLYSAFSRDFRSRLSATAHRDEWDAVTKSLIDRMNDDEALSASELALDAFDQKYIAALFSENVLILEQGRVRFFHETFFDFVFAVQFAPRGDELVAYFVSAGETLFRRAQLRQVLAFIATDNRSTFVAEVLLVLGSEMREHLKPIALSTLTEFEPSAADWLAVATVVNSRGPHAENLISLLSRPAWFIVADSHGDVAALLDDDTYGTTVGRLIADGSNVLSRVVELLTSRASTSDEWAATLRSVADRPYEPGLVDFAINGMKTGLFRTDGDLTHQMPWRLFHNLREKDPAGAVRLLGAYLQRLEQTAIETGAAPDLADPSNSFDELQPLADAEAALFVQEVLGFVVTLAKPNLYSDSPFGRWEYRSPDRVMLGFDEQIFYALDEALQRIAPVEATKTIEAVKLLSGEDLGSLDFLACRMLRASGLADAGSSWLLATDTHLAVGWSSSSRWESRRLIEMSSLKCTDELYALLEARLMDFVPSWEKMANRISLDSRGSTQLELLTALPSHRLSVRAASRISELKRKFPYWMPAEPSGMSGGSVGSPVATKSAMKMSDAQWLKAINTHVGDHTRVANGEFVGGARELAQTFGALVKDDPDRFVKLVLQLDSPNLEPYLEEALRQSAGAIGVDELTNLCLKLRHDYGETGSRAISFAIGQLPAEANDELVRLLIEMSSDADPVADRPPYLDKKTGTYSVDYAGAGLNSARGGAAAAIRAILFAQPQRTEELLPTVLRLSKDPTLAVRAMAAEATLPIINTDLAAALDIAEDLTQSSIELYTTRSLVELLRWSTLNDPDRFATAIERAIGGPDVRAAGSVWLNLFLRDALRSPVTLKYEDLPEDARIGAAQSLRHVPEQNVELASQMFDDPSAEVRKEAALTLRRLDRMSADQSQHLVERFLDSRSFDEHSGVLLTAVTEDSQLLPTRIMEACDRFVISVENASLPRTPDYQVELVAEISLRLYHQGDDATRKACLDLIDRLTAVQAWGIDRALRDER